MTNSAFSLLVCALSGWVNRQQEHVIGYLQEENRVLREHIGKRRILFTDKQRCRLAAKAKLLGRKKFFELGCIVTPDTQLRGYRQAPGRMDFSFPERKMPRPLLNGV